MRRDDRIAELERAASPERALARWLALAHTGASPAPPKLGPPPPPRVAAASVSEPSIARAPRPGAPPPEAAPLAAPDGEAAPFELVTRAWPFAPAPAAAAPAPAIAAGPEPIAPAAPRPPEELLAAIEATLGEHLKAATIAALLAPIRREIDARGAVDPAKVTAAFEQLEDVVEALLFAQPARP